MKTSVLFAVLAIGAIIALAGLAVAAGPAANVLGSQDSKGDTKGMMGGSGGCHQSGGQSAQNQYRNGGDCPGTCQNELQNNYSWSCGDCNMTCTCTTTQNQGADCPGTCDSCNDRNWDRNYCGQ